MNWNIVSAVGTVTAAFVGIAGILINLFEKRKRLDVVFEMIPSFVFVMGNNSTRPIAITKLTIESNDHIFYVEYFQGINEFIIPPSTIRHMYLSTKKIYDSYFAYNMPAFCNPKDKIVIVLHDNLHRKYRFNHNLTIGFFKEATVGSENNDQL